MKKTLLVIKNELITVLSRPSFWFTTIGIPAVSFMVFIIAGTLNSNSSASQTVSQIVMGSQDSLPEGYVDESGLLVEIPENVPSGTFLSFPDETSAKSALAQGKISAYYIVPADYLASGQIRSIRQDFSPFASLGGNTELFKWILQVNLAGGDIPLANFLNNTVMVEDHSLVPVAAPDESNPLGFWAPYAVTLIFYFLIMGSASLLLSSVSKEKENRVMEILLTSTTPRQLLSGKITGLGIAGVLQTLLWVGTGVLLFNLSGRTFSVPSFINLPPSFLLWGLVFFILGYAVYASLMAGLGALAPNMREATQLVIIIMLPLIIPLFFSSTVFMEEPNGILATVLSLFPLSAPVAMMARLSAGGVPVWQTFLSAFLLAATSIFIIRAVAGMFRAQTLVSGSPIKFRIYVNSLLGKYK